MGSFVELFDHGVIYGIIGRIVCWDIHGIICGVIHGVIGGIISGDIRGVIHGIVRRIICGVVWEEIPEITDCRSGGSRIFRWGGGADPLGGCRPLMHTLFGQNICKNKRN